MKYNVFAPGQNRMPSRHAQPIAKHAPASWRTHVDRSDNLPVIIEDQNVEFALNNMKRLALFHMPVRPKENILAQCDDHLLNVILVVPVKT